MPLGQEDFIPIIPIVPILKTKTTVSFFFFPFFKDFIYLFLEKRREGEREGEKQQCVVASCAPPPGTLPAPQACALTGNRTSNTLVGRPVLNPRNYSC